MDIRLVVFDIAGTTVYDGDAVHRCLALALESAGFRASRDEINAVMGISKPTAIASLIDYPETDPLVGSIFAEFLDRMIAHYHTSPDVAPIAGAEDEFQRLHDLGIKVALDTGFSRSVVDIVLGRLGWTASGLVDVVVASDEAPRGRPAPDMIERAMALCGVESALSVAKVGDTPSDLLEGTNAGCSIVVGVTGGSHTESELRAYPHTHLIETVAQLRAVIPAVARGAML